MPRLARHRPVGGPLARRERVRVIDDRRFPGRNGTAGVVLRIRQDVDTHYGYEVLFRGGERHVFYRDELAGLNERVGFVRLFGFALGVVPL